MDTRQSQLKQEHVKNGSSDQIGRDIQDTRRNMDETLDALGDRLHPRHLLDDVIDMVRSGNGKQSGRQMAQSGKQVGRSVAREIREHPIPALLAGAGIAWWVFDSMSDDDEEFEARRNYPMQPPHPVAEPGDEYYPENSHYDYYIGQEIESGSEDSDDSSESETGDGVKEKAARAKEKMKGSAAEAGHRMSMKKEEIKAGARARGSRARQRGADAGRAMRRGSERGGRAVQRGAMEVQDRVQRASDEHPLAMGGALLAAGLLTGLLFGRTPAEDRWMGERSDTMKDDARAKGQEMKDRAKDAAHQASGAALDEAERQGVTPEHLAEKSSRVVEKSMEAGKSQAKEEKMTPEDLKEKSKSVADAAKTAAKAEADQGKKEQKPSSTS